jgi:phage terminase large subunit GpA-like protein
MSLQELRRLPYCRPSPILSTVTWATELVYLAPPFPTSEPGPWRVEHVAAFARPGGPIEALDDPACETVVMVKGSQTGWTTTSLCYLAKEMTVDPSSAMVVMNSSSDAREKSTESWLPLWEGSPGLQKFLPINRRRDWTKLHQRIGGGTVFWIGANSPGKLGGKPIRRLILDEVEKYPQQSKGEAGAAALARQRTKAFRKKGLAKIIEGSTPTDDQGEIWLQWLNGDQRKLSVPCWSCGAEQIMTWSQFRVDMKLAQTNPSGACLGAHYECAACRVPWTDAQRWGAVDRGTWRATSQAKDPKMRSFHCPSWLSKFVTHSYLAAQWIKAQESKSALQDFINAECGEPYVHYENLLRSSVFAELEGHYDGGQCFADVEPYRSEYAETERCVFGGADVQKGYLVAVFRQFIQGGDSALIWAGDVSSFAALDELAAKFDARFILVDQRYRTSEVQEWCATHTGYVPCLGVGRRGRSLFAVNHFDLNEGRARSERTGVARIIEILEHDPDMLKDMLARLIQKGEGARRWLVPRGQSADRAYCDQMTAERNVNGRWINPTHRPNHYWDAECLALLAAKRYGVFQEIGEETST